MKKYMSKDCKSLDNSCLPKEICFYKIFLTNKIINKKIIYSLIYLKIVLTNNNLSPHLWCDIKFIKIMWVRRVSYYNLIQNRNKNL